MGISPANAPLLAHARPLDEVALPVSADAFADRPFVVRGGADQWAARRRWSFDFFAERGRGVPVVLECGNVMQHATRYRAADLGAYVDAIRRGGDRPEGYLSVFEVFARWPELRADVDFGAFAARRPIRFPRAWIGPGGTVTGLHADYPDNLVAQLVGHKTFHLIPPGEGHRLHPGPRYEYGIRMSRVDLLADGPEQWPSMADVPLFRAALAPGDLLYLPGGWWHHVMARTPSISVNCFGVGVGAFVRNELRELARAGLHRLGLIGRGDCTCHGTLDGRRMSRKAIERRLLARAGGDRC